MRILTGLLWTIFACPLIAWFAWISLSSAVHGHATTTGVVALGLATLLAAFFPALAGRWGLALLAALAALGISVLVFGMVIRAFVAHTS